MGLVVFPIKGRLIVWQEGCICQNGKKMGVGNFKNG
jgi:hypothetical protein